MEIIYKKAHLIINEKEESAIFYFTTVLHYSTLEFTSLKLEIKFKFIYYFILAGSGKKIKLDPDVSDPDPQHCFTQKKVIIVLLYGCVQVVGILTGRSRSSMSTASRSASGKRAL